MKRGSSGLSLLVPVNKPSGMTSHDVVNRCRRIFGERRVGHTGTLDPLATGVLPICVGPATRLDRFMTSQTKSYRVTMGFGFETTTDDIEGDPVAFASIPSDLASGDFAEQYVEGLVGKSEQVPPAYSAIKVDGKKAYDLARAGKDVTLEPRPIEVFESRLVSRDSGTTREELTWTIDFTVSKGTYIRALVRDIGRELGTCAHVKALERRSAGLLKLEDCMTLDTVESLKSSAAIDPIRVLGIRFAFADSYAKAVSSGNRLSAGKIQLREQIGHGTTLASTCCSAESLASAAAPRDSELVAMVVENKLKAIYRFSETREAYLPECVFSIGVTRV